ncbi:MAG: Amuc_1102 family pilus-like protein, partial [Terrimicrobiaceae bacterium]
RMRPSFATLSFASLALLVIGAPLRAQQAALNSEVAISKIEANFIDSPKISAAGYTKKSQGRPGQWLEVEVTFDRAAMPKEPKFAEELTFNYYILLKNENVTEDKKPTLLTGSVTHVHVPQEKGLHAVAYVSPRTLAKFFDGKVPVNAQTALVDIGVTVTGKSGLLAIFTLKGTVKGDKGWWDTGLYTPTPGAVLNKSETPFAPLEWDFYEAIKSKAGN